jgi:enamine deaminase RidA (YjgF/YER057c/UK114 family)
MEEGKVSMPSSRRLISTGSPFEKTMGYSRAVVQGDWCFVSGVTGYDYTSMMMPGAVAEQAQNCFATIEAVLKEAEFAMQDIARVQYTVTDRDFVPDLRPVLERWLGDIRPAATMVIADLIEPAMKVEIEVTAFKG